MVFHFVYYTVKIICLIGLKTPYYVIVPSMTTYTITEQNSVFSDLLFKLFSNDDVRTTKKDPFQVKKVSVSSTDYKLVTYNEFKVTHSSISDLGILRSVLFTKDNKMKCFSPPKSHHIDMFQGLYPEIKNVSVEEFIDGTMINVFWDEARDTWEIMTRKNIGANNSYYRYNKNIKQRSFNKLFFETFDKSKLEWDKLDKSCVYSFVMRHPENRIIAYVNEPELYLVEAYHITSTINTDDIKQSKYEIFVVPRDYLQSSSTFTNSDVKFPKTFTFDSYSSLFSSAEEHSPNGNIIKGYILRDNEKNIRSKVVTDEYTYVKDMKANIPDMRFLYLTLRNQRMINKYLHYFPEHENMFAHYYTFLQDYTHCLYSFYCDCYIKKNKPLKEYTSNFRTHMYKLHGIFMDNCRPQGRSLTLNDVMTYVNTMDVPLLFKTMFTAMN